LITVDDPKKPSEIYNKFLILSERIGDLIYGERDFTKIKEFIKSKLQKSSKPKNITITEVIESSIAQEKSSRKTMGVVISSSIILLSISLILYIIYYIFISLLDVMEWWVLAIVFMMIIIPAILITAYWIAIGDY